MGPRGEIVPPKETRERLGLLPHARIEYKVEDGTLVVGLIPILHEVLNEAPVVETTLGELRRSRNELSREAGS